MSEFATAGFVRRRRIIEDALAEVLRKVGDVGVDIEGDRRLYVTVRRSEGLIEQEGFSLWDMAAELEAKL
ncbi:MAG TPA: hypothetical protein PLR59_08610 [Brevundimonas sp.]|nr:hypothetical protein [Brevundimonas sp.]